MKKGLFIVFEGVDGSGKTTQRDLFASNLLELSKHNSILLTREAWADKELKRKLAEDKDAYKDGLNFARLFVGDRANHSIRLMTPALRQGTHVLCDRYILSTCAYQSTQCVDLNKLFDLHKNKGITKPDLTIFVDTNADVALKRIGSRGHKAEVFEQEKFMKELVKNYRDIISKHGGFLGKTIVVNGNQSIAKVHSDIKKAFLPIYKEWESKT